MKNVLLISFSVNPNASAQLFIRQGTPNVGKVSLELEQLWHTAVESMRNAYPISAIFRCVVSFITWMIVRTCGNVSPACPFVSGGSIVTAVLAYFVLDEPLTLQKMVGTANICPGVTNLTYNKDCIS